MNTRLLFGIASLLLAGCIPQTDAPLSDAQSGVVVSNLPSITMPALSTGTLMIGQKDAPVHMTLFTNYDCAYCKDFEQTIMPRLQKDFIETGKLHISIISVPLLKYPNSDRNARLLLCGVKEDSGSFIHQQLFNGQSAFPALEACMNDEEFLQTMIGEQQAIIQKLNVSLVPTYFIEETQFTGLPEYADLRGQIEAAIQKN